MANVGDRLFINSGYFMKISEVIVTESDNGYVFKIETFVSCNNPYNVGDTSLAETFTQMTRVS